MSEKLILEGDFEHGVASWEDGFTRIGKDALLYQIKEFLGDADEVYDSYDDDGCSRYVYRDIRIVVERIESEH